MTTEQALEHYIDHGIDGLSIEDMDKVYIHWLENPDEYLDEIVDNILCCSFGNYDYIKGELLGAYNSNMRRYIYFNSEANKYYCLEYMEDYPTFEKWDFEWYEVYPKEKTIVEYHRKQV